MEKPALTEYLQLWASSLPLHTRASLWTPPPPPSPGTETQTQTQTQRQRQRRNSCDFFVFSLFTKVNLAGKPKLCENVKTKGWRENKSEPSLISLPSVLCWVTGLWLWGAELTAPWCQHNKDCTERDGTEIISYPRVSFCCLSRVLLCRSPSGTQLEPKCQRKRKMDFKGFPGEATGATLLAEIKSVL